MQHWMDYRDGRWLPASVDPQAEVDVHRESTTHARWFKGACLSFKWRELPSYLSSSLSVKAYKTVARLKLGSHGLARQVPGQ
jgi:hypothetical protein